MQWINHTKFINTPISKILIETINICRVLVNRMEAYPLSEYIFQTTFLKMTGASEQKLKCISWEMATYDYDYRHKVLSKPLGECSTYEDKKVIFDEIIACIKQIDPDFKMVSIFSKKEKKDILDNLKGIFYQLEDSVLVDWHKCDYVDFLTKYKALKPSCFCNYQPKNDKNNSKESLKLIESDLKHIYENIVYKHRNRCAHNLQSYQTNIPSIKTLAKSGNEHNNYFIMYFTLVLLDEIFMRAYKIFLEVCSESF